jgi:hypothetical protein
MDKTRHEIDSFSAYEAKIKNDVTLTPVEKSELLDDLESQDLEKKL